MQQSDQTLKGYIVQLYNLTASEDHSSPVESCEHKKGKMPVVQLCWLTLARQLEVTEELTAA